MHLLLTIDDEANCYVTGERPPDDEDKIRAREGVRLMLQLNDVLNTTIMQMIVLDPED